MRTVSFVFILLLTVPSFAQSGATLPNAPKAQTSSPDKETPITRSEAEHMALKNNPRITAAHLLARAAGQITREIRSSELPQINGSMTAVKAEDGSRIGSGALTSSRLYTHAGAGGTLSQLITDFGHTSELVTSTRLQAEAQQQSALATEQDVLLSTDQTFYRLLDAQSILEVAKATVAARGDVQNLTQALAMSSLKSDLDLSIASANLSQAQLLELDAENSVTSASAALAELLVEPPNTLFRAVEDSSSAPPPPPQDSPTLTADAQTHRPDLLALQSSAQSDQKFARAQELNHLPSISALAIGGVTPIRADGAYDQNWYAAAGVNLTLPIFTGFRISAQTEEAHLRERAATKQAQELSDAIARDVRVATLAAQTAFRRIAVTDAFRTQATQALGLAQTRYKLGLSSIVELSQAQLQSTQAVMASVNARFDYLLALRTLDYARGQLSP